MKAVEPIIHRDNRMQVLQALPAALVIPEILHARGVIESLGPLEIEVETHAGERRHLTVEPVPLGEKLTWADPDAEAIPAFRRHLDQNYRFVVAARSGE